METSESQHKLLEFKKRTNLCRVVTYWGNKYELASQVTVSLIRVFKDWPRAGWIKDNASKNEWLENVFGNIFLSYSWKDHVIADDTDIFDIIGISKYIRYWQNEYKNALEAIDKLDEINRSIFIDGLKHIESIQRAPPEFLRIITDMKSVICNAETVSEEDFNEIIKRLI